MALLLLSGCVKDSLFDIFKSNESELVVSVDIPEPTVMKTRAGITGGLIESLYVLMFDKNGLFLSRHKGELVASGNYANYRFKDIPMNDDGDSRILHFVANATWTNFSDAASIGKSESEIIPSITVTGDIVAYWQRVVVANGMPGPKGTTIDLSETIHLLRNVAKISVKNLTNEPTSTKYITNISYTIGQYIDKGTVAPYSPSTGEFDKEAVTEPDGTLVSIREDESEFVAAQDGSNGEISVPKYIYERKNSVAQSQTYIIIKGYFQTELVSNNTTVPCYYKIDLADKEATQLLDLQRNYHYIVTINDAAKAGYSTLADAMNNAASNNINASVAVSEYTAISDGQDILRMEKAVFSFVRANQDFSISYAYVDGITGATNNAGVNISLTQDASQPVVDANGISYTTTNGATITGRTASFVPPTDIYQATVTLQKNSLTRKVLLRLRSPMNFLNLTATPNPIASGVGQIVNLSFKFPADISPAVFPMPIYVTTKKLSPDPSVGSQNLSIDPSPSGDYRYIYMAPYLGFNADGVTPKAHNIFMVSNSPSTNENVKLSAELFNDAMMQITSANMSALTAMSFTPNPVMRTAGTPVTLYFTIPAGQTAPYQIGIFTDHLEYVSQSTGTSCEWDNEQVCYVYTTSTTGIQTIQFKTKDAASDEIVRIDGYRFASIWTSRTTSAGAFATSTIAYPAGFGIGNAANISFSFNTLGQQYVGSGIWIYFYAQNLEPISGSDMETVSPGVYRKWVTTTGTQTANFTQKNLPTTEVITLKSDAFTDAVITSTLGYNFLSPVTQVTRPYFTTGTGTTTENKPSGTNTTTTRYLRFRVPADATRSAANPLWIWLSSGSGLSYYSTPSGCTIFNPSGNAITGNNTLNTTTTTGYWIQVTAVTQTDCYIVVRNRSANYAQPIIMKSVTGQGSTTQSTNSNVYFETVNLN